MNSLRLQLAVAGFLAIYIPVLVMFAVGLLTEDRISETRNGVEYRMTESRDAPRWALVTVIALAPAAAGLAWWWAGRAVRPIQHVRTVAEEIDLTDLSRRIRLTRGPTEVTALAAGFDAMLARLECSAATQRRLIEKTSHELRTPLAVLCTNADVILAHPNPSLELYRDGLKRSKTAASRLQVTIEELLVDARGRARTLDRRPADLAAICRSVLDDISVLAKAKDVELSLTGATEAPCRLDEPTVRRAVANLVDNAVRHAPAGSIVELALIVTDSLASVAVTDHGPGFRSHNSPGSSSASGGRAMAPAAQAWGCRSRVRSRRRTAVS